MNNITFLPVGLFDLLEHGNDGADFVQIVVAGVIDRGIFLGDNTENFFTGSRRAFAHDLTEQALAAGTTDSQGDYGSGKDHGVTQSQDAQLFRDGQVFDVVVKDGLRRFFFDFGRASRTTGISFAFGIASGGGFF